MNKLVCNLPIRYLSIASLPLEPETYNVHQIYVFDFYIEKAVLASDKTLLLGKANNLPLTVIHAKKMFPFFCKTRSLLLQGKIQNGFCFFPLLCKKKQIGIFPFYRQKAPCRQEIMAIKSASIAQALCKIHFPNSLQEVEEGLETMASFEIAVFLSACSSFSRFKSPCSLSCEVKLPFSLSSQQKEVLEEIYKDMEKNCSTARIVHGEVGSGKTILGVLAALKCVINGKRAIWLTPTTLLAAQVFSIFDRILQENSYLFSLCNLSAQKKQTLSKADIVIGTHSLLFASFDSIGLLIIDEQQRFGVAQRSQLLKNQEADLLMLSATPIPRTYFLMKHYLAAEDSLAYSFLRGNTTSCDTYVLHVSSMNKLLERVQILCQREKLVWIARSISRSQQLHSLFADQCNCYLLHSRQKNKCEILAQFEKAENGLLISTSVLEVGIDISLDYIVIEDADCFGLSQLHQLRGRVGRRGKKGCCVLLGKNISKLQKIKRANDGFTITELDLTTRGAGKLHGTSQSGELPFIFLRTYEKGKLQPREWNEDILQKAKEVILSEDILSFFSESKIQL